MTHDSNALDVESFEELADAGRVVNGDEPLAFDA